MAVGPEAERHSRRGDGWGLVEAEACEGGRDKTHAVGRSV